MPILRRADPSTTNGTALSRHPFDALQEESMQRLLLLPLLSLIPLLAFTGCATRKPAVAQKPTAETPMPPAKSEMAMPTTKGSLKVVAPNAGQKITTADIPVQVAVSDFKVSSDHVGMPDVDGEGHIHV